MNNMPTTSNALHQSDDTMSRKKAQKKSVQNHVIMVSGVEKEYAIRKMAKMDYGGNGEG
jgi:cell division protein YceG involved in septum cleavage